MYSKPDSNVTRPYDSRDGAEAPLTVPGGEEVVAAVRFDLDEDRLAQVP